MKLVSAGLIVVSSLIWPAIPLGGEPPADTRHAQLQSLQRSKECNYDRIMVGPDGNEVTVWQNDARYILDVRQMLPPSAVIIGRIYGRSNSSLDKLVVFGGSGLRLFPIRWSTNGDRLYIRVREPRERIFAIDPLGKQVEETSLPQAWKFTDLKAVSHGGIDILRAPLILAKVGKIDGKEFVRGSVTLGKTVELLGARKSDLELVRFMSGKAVGTGINSGHTRLLTAFPDERDFRGGISYLGVAGRSEGDDYLPYQLPIVDLDTGRVAGKFGPEELQLEKPDGLESGIEQLNHRLNNDGGLVLDASLSHQTLMALAVFSNGDRRVIRIGRLGSTEKSICSRRATAPSAHVSILRVDARGRKTDRQASPILVLYSVGGTRPRDALLDLHGGPGGSLADDFWSPRALRLLRPNLDIISIEYAGSLGGGADLTRRLSRGGIDELRKDMDGVAAWLSKRDYKKVYLLAGSFGSVPAILALGKHRPLFAASFHIAPVLRLQDPHVWAQRGTGLRPNNPDTQLAYELASFGGAKRRNRFAEELKLAVLDARLGQNDHIYFGDLDDISKPEQLPSNAKAKVTVIPGTGHVVLGADLDVWRDIENNMK